MITSLDSVISFSTPFILSSNSPRNIAVDDSLSQSFDDGGLSYTRLTDEDGVILGSSGQDSYNSSNLFFSADDGVHLLLAGHLSHINGELGQVFILLLCIGRLAVDSLGSSDSLYCLLDKLTLGNVGFLEGCLNSCLL
ncbi:hypothetical protein HG530_014050 [Fusarium avenaceum]|nr:hypothetical protein HG530_014050 [Fusarium avenaceum]